ncbi:MAG: class I SAM-dependent methyltransferase [Planctomycetota bacterium]|nr:class I SAM-dependent methyltransferase [Planctomycetota bacterium]
MCVPWAGSGLGRLLDVGSGAGDKVVKYTHLGWRVTGVETDAQAAAQAREYHALDVRAGYLHDQRFPGASFDAVTLLFVLEHVPAPVELLREVHRILAPGGALLIDVPNFDSALRETFGAAWSQYAIPEHWLLPTEATLRGMAERAGFQVESVRHRASRSLYKVCLERARRLGALDPELPTADADIERWLERRAAAPRGDLMLLLARKPGTP